MPVVVRYSTSDRGVPLGTGCRQQEISNDDPGSLVCALDSDARSAGTVPTRFKAGLNWIREPAKGVVAARVRDLAKKVRDRLYSCLLGDRILSPSQKDIGAGDSL